MKTKTSAGRLNALTARLKNRLIREGKLCKINRKAASPPTKNLKAQLKQQAARFAKFIEMRNVQGNVSPLQQTKEEDIESEDNPRAPREEPTSVKAVSKSKDNDGRGRNTYREGKVVKRGKPSVCSRSEIAIDAAKVLANLSKGPQRPSPVKRGTPSIYNMSKSEMEAAEALVLLSKGPQRPVKREKQSVDNMWKSDIQAVEGLVRLSKGPQRPNNKMVPVKHEKPSVCNRSKSKAEGVDVLTLLSGEQQQSNNEVVPVESENANFSETVINGNKVPTEIINSLTRLAQEKNGVDSKRVSPGVLGKHLTNVLQLSKYEVLGQTVRMKRQCFKIARETGMVVPVEIGEFQLHEDYTFTKQNGQCFKTYEEIELVRAVAEGRIGKTNENMKRNQRGSNAPDPSDKEACEKYRNNRNKNNESARKSKHKGQKKNVQNEIRTNFLNNDDTARAIEMQNLDQRIKKLRLEIILKAALRNMKLS